MAGRGSRFRQKGYKDSKPFIDVEGKPMIQRVIENLNIVPENILVDGNKFFPYRHKGEIIPHVCIKGGDNKYSAIAAASIIAKVERDNYIRHLCKENPELIERYNIESNKGYGAKTHIEGIKKYGISKWHRKTFGICQNY